jgi:hypothetical protein
VTKEWYQHNDVSNKLKQALEMVIVGQALDITFAGLDSGKCTVDVIYNGETITFLNKNPTLNMQETPVVETFVTTETEECLTPEETVVAAASKPKRKSK